MLYIFFTVVYADIFGKSLLMADFIGVIKKRIDYFRVNVFPSNKFKCTCWCVLN